MCVCVTTACVSLLAKALDTQAVGRDSSLIRTIKIDLKIIVRSDFI